MKWNGLSLWLVVHWKCKYFFSSRFLSAIPFHWIETITATYSYIINLCSKFEVEMKWEKKRILNYVSNVELSFGEQSFGFNINIDIKSFQWYVSLLQWWVRLIFFSFIHLTKRKKHVRIWYVDWNGIRPHATKRKKAKQKNWSNNFLQPVKLSTSTTIEREMKNAWQIENNRISCHLCQI